ncbi:MAG: 1-acyl-sn-glycerol-3-phosphate acyltransferase [Succinivibrio sp.]|uniref:1-acyl-sn-glycerol-3-phosphate acyltransferase n=1 Tax=Succinivibrio dextrinosolvens TaxID=83771 RepID=UPI00241F2444|nr:1-acyl-sn-glycerol-3-phosphate acyltransferase [Succinivibrio dextrinosolvens]MBQ3679450.1 1-acyl-sn-glycerol-3-phosphate acyltransferase [Succinivibrio sp.]
MTTETNDINKITSNDPVFDDIRPCRDDEVQSELNKIISDEMVINSILRFRYPIFSKKFGFLLKPFVKAYLKNKVSKITTIRQFQEMVSSFMKKVVDSTTDGVELVGFDKLEKNKGYLFISNHRDISLDPAFIDLALFLSGRDTVRIAIGDNLLRLPAATSLMRLNRSFIVRRSIEAPREKLKALTHLSNYIGLSIEEGISIWIAQREGRAKDGNDKTEDAVLKMISLYGRQKKQDFKEYMSSLNIVPVSITYEYDPNDLAKAKELYEKEKNGEYKKNEFEDIDTITRGIRGYKGHVKLVAGEPITGGFETAEELSAIIDKFVWNNYELYPSALISAGVTDGISNSDKEKFESRIASYPEYLRDRIKAMYAAPFYNKDRS